MGILCVPWASLVLTMEARPVIFLLSEVAETSCEILLIYFRSNSGMWDAENAFFSFFVIPSQLLLLYPNLK